MKLRLETTYGRPVELFDVSGASEFGLVVLQKVVREVFGLVPDEDEPEKDYLNRPAEFAVQAPVALVPLQEGAWAARVMLVEIPEFPAVAPGVILEGLVTLEGCAMEHIQSALRNGLTSGQKKVERVQLLTGFAFNRDFMPSAAELERGARVNTIIREPVWVTAAGG